MGKLDVTVLRYLSKEDFRVLTSVSKKSNFEKTYFLNLNSVLSFVIILLILIMFYLIGGNGYEKSRVSSTSISGLDRWSSSRGSTQGSPGIV